MFCGQTVPFAIVMVVDVAGALQAGADGDDGDVVDELPEPPPHAIAAVTAIAATAAAPIIRYVMGTQDSSRYFAR
jgi:hypothetical protein